MPNAPVYAQNGQQNRQTQQAQSGPGRRTDSVSHPVEPRHLAVRPDPNRGANS